MGIQKLVGRVRKVFEAVDAETPSKDLADLTLTQQLELLVALGAAEYEQVIANGRAVWTGTTAAIAGVVAVPTTAHMLAIWNTEPDGGDSLVIDFVAAQNVVSTAVASQAQILVNQGQVRETGPADAALTFKKCNGMGQVGKAVDVPAITILNATALPATTGLAANWVPVGQNGVKAGAAATPGYGMYEKLNGRFICPPGRYFAMHVLANVVGETFVTFMGFHRKRMALA